MTRPNALFHLVEVLVWPQVGDQHHSTKTPKPFSREIHGVHLVEKTTWNTYDWSHDHPFSRGSTWLDWRRHGRIPQGCYLCPTSVVSYRGIPDHVEPKHERQHPTSKKHPSEGFGIAPKKGNKRTQARKAAPDEQETPKRGIWHRPQKRQKKQKKKHERQHPTSKKHPSEGFGIAPKKGKKQKKHERQRPTSKKHPSEGFGIAPKKGKAALG